MKIDGIDWLIDQSIDFNCIPIHLWLLYDERLGHTLYVYIYLFSRNFYTRLCVIKYSYLILIICTQLYGWLVGCFFIAYQPLYVKQNQICFYIYHHHQVTMLAQISLTLAICRYYPSPSAALPDYILYPYRAVVGRFLLVGKHWHVMWGRHLWVRPCFSNSCPVYFVRLI